jgi:hypothetical protein
MGSDPPQQPSGLPIKACDYIRGAVHASAAHRCSAYRPCHFSEVSTAHSNTNWE